MNTNNELVKRMEVNELYISGRVRKIVEILLDAQQVITISQLADELGVSNRTIHRDLKNVEEILAVCRLTLERKSGLGLELIGHQEDVKRLKLRLEHVEYTDFRPEERQIFILITLLKTNEPLKLHSLASELQVTTATVSHDLDDIQSTLAEYQLTLIRRRGYGVKIAGNEKDKRAALRHIVAEYLDDFDFISLLKDDKEQKVQNNISIISDRLLGIVNPEKLSIIEQEVEKVKTVLPYELADSAYIGLIVHLALAIERLQQGDTIQFDIDYLQQIQETKEYQIAQKMIQSLEESLEMSIPVDEIGYITMHLLGAKLKVNHEHLIEDSNFDIAFQAKQLINYVSHTLDVDLQGNERLLNDLVAHLQPTMYRLRQKMIIKNPLIEEIMRDYEELFDIIEAGVTETFPDIDFPQEEIGYLVLHFGSVLIHSKKDLELHALVICPSGIGTAKMLGERLLQKVPEIKRIENKSIFDVEQIEQNDYDLIVSTIPLQGNIEYVLASPILSKQDIDHINKFVRRQKVKRSVVKKRDDTKIEPNIVDRLQALQNHSKAMLAILANFYVGSIRKVLTMGEVLAQICEELASKQILDDEQEVLNDLLAREKIGGLGIPDTTMALYHTRSSGIREISFSIYDLQEAHQVNGMDGQTMEIDRILLMLAPRDINQQALEIVSLISGLIISNEQAIELFESGTEAALHLFISNHLNEFMSERL